MFFFCTQNSDHAIGWEGKKVTFKLVTMLRAEYCPCPVEYGYCSF